MQAASDAADGTALIHFAFDLLLIDGADVANRRLVERKARLERILTVAPPAIRYSDHHPRRRPALTRRGVRGAY